MAWEQLRGQPGARPYPLIAAEVEFQAANLREVADRSEGFNHLASGAGDVLLVGTNVFLHCTLFMQVNWRAEFDVRRARLLVPLLVLDELDDKTFSGNARLSKRACRVLREFDGFMRRSRAASLPRFEITSRWRYSLTRTATADA